MLGQMRKLLILALSSGCSFALQSRPPKGRNECTASPVFAVVDTIVTAAALGATIYGASRVDDTGNVVAGTGGLTTIAFMASAGSGYRWAGQCQEARMQSVASR